MTNSVLTDIALERCRQDIKWGPQDHNQMIWLGILAEEFGEAAKECNEFYFRDTTEGRFQTLRHELIQTAAVCVAMIESLDRNGE